jgi:four helix bundle protein
VIENIANGNSRRSADDRNRFFDVAVGSGLECAACLDVAHVKQLISRECAIEGKTRLQHIVLMTVGLKAAGSPVVKEEFEGYCAEHPEQEPPLFFHENLEVYRLALELVREVDGLCRSAAISARHAAALDKNTTSIVLNIAEGNGRYGSMDHRRFLDIAHSCAMNAAARLDLLVAKVVLAFRTYPRPSSCLAALFPCCWVCAGIWMEIERHPSDDMRAIHLYPNPSRDLVLFRFGQEEEARSGLGSR